jgi:hypothetical protein
MQSPKLIYFERADVAKRAGVSAAVVLRDVFLARLRVAARTVRGTRLFDPRDVDRYIADRAARREARA